MENLTKRRRKSEPLSKEEFKSLQKYLNTFHTLVDAAEEIDINRQTLERVKIIGSGSPETISKVRKAMKKSKVLIAA